MDTNKETPSPQSVEPTSSGNYFNGNPDLNLICLQDTSTSNYNLPPGYPPGCPPPAGYFPSGYTLGYHSGYPVYTPGYQEICYRLLLKNEELEKKNEELKKQTEQTNLNKPLETSRYQTDNQRHQTITSVQTDFRRDRSRSPDRVSYRRESSRSPDRVSYRRNPSISPDRVSCKRDRSISPDRTSYQSRSQNQTSDKSKQLPNLDSLYNSMKLLRSINKFFKKGMCKFPDCKNPLCQFSHSSVICPHCYNECQYNHPKCYKCGLSNNYKTCKYFIKGICRHKHGVESNKSGSCGYLHGWKCYSCKINNSNVYSTCIKCNGPRMEINGF